MHSLDHIGITGPGFLGFLALVFVLSVVATFRRQRRSGRFWMAGVLLAFVIALTGVAASINAYYAYLPNLGSLWGWRAADQASWETARRLAAATETNRGDPAHGAVVQVAIPGLTSHFHARDAQVYLPPAWFRRPHPPLPVVELLHGTPGTPMDWTRSAAADVVSDAYAAPHNGSAPILVLPDINGSFAADSECTNGTAGNVETYLTVDVPNWVRTYLHPSHRPRRWAIGGLSEGGTCAMDIALRHPRQFPTFLDYAGEEHITRHGGATSLFRGTPRQRRDAVRSYDPIYLLDHIHRASRLAGWFGVGTKDNGTSVVIERLYERASRLGIHAHLVLSKDGHHSFRVWKRLFAQSLPSLAERLLLDHPHRQSAVRTGSAKALPQPTPSRLTPDTG